MPLTGTEKTTAKRQVMGRIKGPIDTLGFRLVGGGKTNGTFELTDAKSDVLVVFLDVPTFDTFFRIATYWRASDETVVGRGPYSLPYECPNHPGDRRYTFRFHRDSASQQRCAENIVDWIRDVALPWFREKPTGQWSNPNVVRT